MSKLQNTHRTVLNYAKTLNAVFATDLFCSADGFLGLGAISAGTQVCKAVNLAERSFFFSLGNARRGKSECPTFLKS